MIRALAVLVRNISSVMDVQVQHRFDEASYAAFYEINNWQLPGVYMPPGDYFIYLKITYGSSRSTQF